MDARLETMRDLYLAGKTYEEIGTEFGISKQRVYQLIGGEMKHKVVIPEERCIYPNLRLWMNENNVSVNKLCRTMYDGRLEPERTEVLRKALKGSNCTKNTIDRILKATGLTYEEAFGRSDTDA